MVKNSPEPVPPKALPFTSALVSGASGFLGRKLCERLQAEGMSVCGLARKSAAGPWQRFVCCDLALAPPPPAALEGVDCIFHLAGKAHALTERKVDEDRYKKINVDGTRHLLESASQAGVQSFVLFSSAHVLENGERATPYSRSKQAAEAALLATQAIPHISILRPTMVYGVGAKGNLPRMISAMQRGWFPPLPEVSNRRSMVHVEDVIDAALLLVSNPLAHRHAYTVADRNSYSIRQIQNWIQTALGRPISTRAVPQIVLRGIAKIGDGIGYLRGRRFLFDSDALDKLLGDACYSSDALYQELGFRAQRQLQEALPEIIASLR